MNRDTLVIAPYDEYPAEIGRMLWMMNDTRARTLDTLSRISPTLIDWFPPNLWMNSIGTLLYHIACIEVDWIYAEVLEQDYPADMKEWFPQEPRDKTGKLTVITGISLDEHLARFKAVRQRVFEVFKTISLEDFRRARSLPQYDVTPEWVLYHLMQHESEHHGEMMTMASMAQAQP